MINVAKMARAESIAEENELVKAGRMRVALPLVGVKQKLSQGAMGRMESQILEEEGIKPENFRVNALPEISGRGGLRAVVAPIRNFKLHGVSAVAANNSARQADLSFMLLRGSYATVLLREIMKPSNLIKAGF
jgi:tRNA pseudouridine13 synthase